MQKEGQAEAKREQGLRVRERPLRGVVLKRKPNTNAKKYGIRVPRIPDPTSRILSTGVRASRNVLEESPISLEAQRCEKRTLFCTKAR